MIERNVETNGLGRRFCCGDIHGAHKALIQVLDLAEFDYENDLLISLGDICDGYSQTYECVEELMKIKNLKLSTGNHDVFFMDYLRTGYPEHIWTSQGGNATVKSYSLKEKKDRDRHEDFLNKGAFYHVLDNKLFVHGGFNWHEPIEDQDGYDLTWDRHLISTALYWEKRQTGDKVNAYDEVFIGHTSTSRLDPTLKPLHFSNVWCLDQGAGFEGKLTLMDIDSHEYWQSDLVKDLYPNEHGR